MRDHYSLSLQWSIHWRLPKYMLTQYCSSDPWIKYALDPSHYKFNGRNAPILLKNASFDSVINSSINTFLMSLSNEYFSWTITAYCIVTSSTFRVPFYIDYFETPECHRRELWNNYTIVSTQMYLLWIMQITVLPVLRTRHNKSSIDLKWKKIKILFVSLFSLSFIIKVCGVIVMAEWAQDMWQCSLVVSIYSFYSIIRLLNILKFSWYILFKIIVIISQIFIIALQTSFTMMNTYWVHAGC